MRGANSHLDFDFDLAKDESEKNPVYYLQYAHARISNLIVRYDNEIKEKTNLDMSLLNEKDEVSLMKKLSAFPTKMNELRQSLEPRKLATYLEEVAAAYHKFYGNHKVINLIIFHYLTQEKIFVMLHKLFKNRVIYFRDYCSRKNVI